MDLLTAVAVSMLPVSRLRAAAIFKELRLEGAARPIEQVLDRCGIRPSSSEGCEAVERSLSAAAAALASGVGQGMQAISFEDARYPGLLACIEDPPPVVWAQGAVECLNSPCVAIIGSRAASPYALQIASRLAAELSERGIVVVSGLARGVDSAGHLGCLTADGRTIAVTGSGLDTVYPPENKRMAQ